MFRPDENHPNKKKYEQIPEELNEKIKSINDQLKSGAIEENEGKLLISDITNKFIDKIYGKTTSNKDVKISNINDKVFNSFWDKKYSTKENKDLSSAKYDFIRALKAIEPLPILTSTATELKKKIDSHNFDDRKRRRIITRINELLKFHGSDDLLSMPEDTHEEVKYLTKEEVLKLAGWVEDQVVKDLIITLFCTGVRLGEAMALDPSKFCEKKVIVTHQIKNGKKVPPKRKKTGSVFIIPWGIESVKRWCSVENKTKYRDKVYDDIVFYSKRFKRADKCISPHDLRHSYAKYLISKGVSITMIALNLRNRIEVCQKYYVGYSNTDETIDFLSGKID